MAYILEAACGCHVGIVRKNNEDNFYFDGRCLEAENEGLKNPAYIEAQIRRCLCYSVFDGMGHCFEWFIISMFIPESNCEMSYVLNTLYMTHCDSIVSDIIYGSYGAYVLENHRYCDIIYEKSRRYDYEQSR